MRAFTFIVISLLGLVLVPEATRALTVSPPVVEMVVGRGESATRSIRLYNETRSEINVQAELAEVGFDDENGVPVFSPPISDDQSLTTWIDGAPPSFAFAAGMVVDVPVSFTVPEEARPGSYVTGVLFSSTPTESIEEGVGIVGKTAVIFLVDVPGEVKNSGQILDFSLTKEAGQRLFNQTPSGFRAQIENTGNVFFVPSGSVVIKNIFGNFVREFIFNEDERRVLPGWKRTFEIKSGSSSHGLAAEWRPFALGRYSATLTVTVGQEIYSESLSYWVVPWRTLGIAGLIILGIFIGIIRRRHYVRSRNN